MARHLVHLHTVFIQALPQVLRVAVQLVYQGELLLKLRHRSENLEVMDPVEVDKRRSGSLMPALPVVFVHYPVAAHHLVPLGVVGI